MNYAERERGCVCVCVCVCVVVVSLSKMKSKKCHNQKNHYILRKRPGKSATAVGLCCLNGF